MVSRISLHIHLTLLTFVSILIAFSLRKRCSFSFMLIVLIIRVCSKSSAYKIQFVGCCGLAVVAGITRSVNNPWGGRNACNPWHYTLQCS
jgi:hypothetical protein